jgi:hypothetical protein
MIPTRNMPPNEQPTATPIIVLLSDLEFGRGVGEEVCVAPVVLWIDELGGVRLVAVSELALIHDYDGFALSY